MAGLVLFHVRVVFCSSGVFFLPVDGVFPPLDGRSCLCRLGDCFMGDCVGKMAAFPSDSIKTKPVHVEPADQIASTFLVCSGFSHSRGLYIY